MKRDIVLAGVGGQGILSIAATIGKAAIEAGMFLKQAEVHGMSQRGGSVSSNLRFADHEIASDLIPFGQADMIISVEPMESLRYLPMLAAEGWIITNTKPFVNISNYPEIDDLLAEIKSQPKYIAIDADQIAKDLGSSKSANMVVLGAATPFLGIDFSFFEKAVSELFLSKGTVVIESNLKAIKAGYEFTITCINNG